MTSIGELAVRMGRARSRFVEDAVIALKETAADETNKADVEEALQEQIGHGRKLVELAELACWHFTSPKGLETETHKTMSWALLVAVNSFRELHDMVTVWTRRHDGVLFEGAQHLGPLIHDLEDRRAELSLAQESTAPAFDPKQVRVAREAYERGEFEELEETIRGLQSPPSQTH